MKVMKSLVIAAVLCVAKVNAIDFSPGGVGKTDDTSGIQTAAYTMDTITETEDSVKKGGTDAEPCDEELLNASSTDEDCTNEFDMANPKDKPGDCDESLDNAKEEENSNEDLDVAKEEDCSEDLDVANEEEDCPNSYDVASTEEGDTAKDDGGGGANSSTNTKGDAGTGGETTGGEVTTGGERIVTTNTKDDPDCPEGYDIADSECSDGYEVAGDDCTDELDVAGADPCDDELKMADKADTTEADDCSQEFSTAGSEAEDTALAATDLYAPPGGVTPANTGNDGEISAEQTAFSVEAIKFQSNDGSSGGALMTTPLVAAAVACAALVVVGVIYMKRRSKKSKEAEHDIFTVDKNSAL